MSSIKEAFTTLFRGEMDEASARSLLVGLYERGESAEEIRAAVEVMRSFMRTFETPSEIADLLIDNCGTGGDKSGSFNISTTVSFILAAGGLFVAKHGNRSITSKSGSADMLEALGINVSLGEEAKRELLLQCGFTFLFAPDYHPALKHIMPIRRSIPHRTIFNLLGPLCNPAHVSHHLIGVYDYAYARKAAQTLQETGSKRGMVIHSRDGMDEASVVGESDYAFFDENGILREGTVHPHDIALKTYPKEAILGADATTNARITYAVLRGESDEAKQAIVLLNAALAFYASGKARDIQDGAEIARELLATKAAFHQMEEIVRISQKLS